MLKKGLYLFIAVIMLFAVLMSGCQKTETPEPTNTKEASSETAAPEDNGEEVEQGPDYFHKYDPPITITLNTIERSAEEYAAGESQLDCGYTRWAKENLGIIYEAKWTVPDAETDLQRLNLALASNDLPDVINVQAGDLSSKLINSNLVHPLKGLLEEYASPLTKQVIDEYQQGLNGQTFALFAKGDDYYAFPEMSDIFGNWKTMWIRQDILDDMGKEMPKTLDEFESLMADYKTANSEGLPFVYNMEPVMQSHNAYPDKWVTDSEGNLAFGSIQPEVKDALATLNNWYEQGLIDEEFFIKDDGQNREKFVAGNGLAIYGNWWYIFWPFPDLWTNAPEAEMRPMHVLAGPDGTASIMHDLDNGYFNNGRAINANFEHPEALVHMLNLQVDSMYRGDKALRDKMAEQGYEFNYAFEELKDPTNPDADGLEQTWDYTVEGPGKYWNTAQPFLAHTGFGFKFNERNYELIDRYGRMKEAAEKGDMNLLNSTDLNDYNANFADPKKFDANTADYDLYTQVKEEGLIKFNMFTSSPTPTMIQSNAYLKKLQDEAFTKIIIGEQPLDSFDKFVEDWLSAGGETITKEVNDWYANK